jgi:Family of unknown function (DUF6130)
MSGPRQVSGRSRQAYAAGDAILFREVGDRLRLPTLDSVPPGWARTSALTSVSSRRGFGVGAAIVTPRLLKSWPRASSGPSTGWRTCASYRCSGRALSTYLHINVDDLPWLWADASDSNTVDIAGVPPGEHKVKIELVDANHNVFPGQVVTLSFTVPDK